MSINPAILTTSSAQNQSQERTASYSPSPWEILNNQVVRCSEVPLPRDFVGEPGHIIPFSPPGCLPPSAADISKGTHNFGSAGQQKVFTGLCHRTVIIQFAWPGIKASGQNFPDALSITRQDLAKMLVADLSFYRQRLDHHKSRRALTESATSPIDPNYDLSKIPFNRLRLARLELYRVAWVPVWWVDL
ncbi:hypothetical protein ONZ45_g9898 [Pleurotus djamor]|nr:hypothetical protein ONZ45_g9898 [Pleurotus djamor]